MATELSNIPLEELQKELKRREAKPNIPRPLPTIEWEGVIKMAADELLDVTEGTYKRNGGDGVQWIYEAVMQAIYGKNILDWLNKKNIRYT